MRKTAPKTFYMRQLDQTALAFSIATGLIVMASFVTALTAFPQRAESAEIAAPAEPEQKQETPAQTEMAQQDTEEDEDPSEVACVLEAS